MFIKTMKKFRFVLLLINVLLSSVASANLTAPAKWLQTCARCSFAFKICREDCLSVIECQQCIGNINQQCLDCRQDLFDEGALIVNPLNGSEHLSCDVTQEMQRDACDVFCRASENLFGNCVVNEAATSFKYCQCEQHHTYKAHERSVESLAFLNNGDLASGSSDRTIKIWNINDVAVKATLSGHKSDVIALAVLTNGHLVSGSSSEINVWNADEQMLLKSVSGLKELSSLLALPNELFASGIGNTISIWDSQSAFIKSNLTGHMNIIYGLTLLRNGDQMASCSQDKTVRIWDWNKGESLLVIKEHSNYIVSLISLPSGLLVGGAYDGFIYTWDTNTGKESRRRAKFFTGIYSLAVLKSGDLACSYKYNSVSILNAKDFSETRRLEGHNDTVNMVLALPDGNLASASRDKTFRVWKINHQMIRLILSAHQESVIELGVLPNGDLASVSLDLTIRIWNTDTGVNTLTMSGGHRRGLIAMAILPNGDIVSGSYDAIQVWSVSEKQVRFKLIDAIHFNLKMLMVLPNGNVAAGYDGGISIWNPNDGSLIRTITQFRGRSMALLPNGLVACAYKIIQLINIDDESLIRTFDTEHTQKINSIAALSNDVIVSAGDDNLIHMWNTNDGRLIRTLTHHTRFINTLIALPNGFFASGASDQLIHIWNGKSGRLMKTLNGHKSTVLSLAVLPNGDLASCSLDTTIIIWNRNW